MRNRAGLILLLVGLCAGQTGTRRGIDTSYLDPTCKPCSDFYRYATGGWTDKNPVPADRSSWDTLDVLTDAGLERERTILEAAMLPGVTGDEKQLGDYYSACMNTAAIDAAGVKPIQPLLDRIAAIRTRQDLVAMLVAMELADGGLTGIRIESAADPDDSNKAIAQIAIRTTGLTMPDRDYYFRDDAATVKIRAAMTDYIVQLEQLAGASAQSAADAAKTVMEFETDLAKPMLTVVQRRDPYAQVHKMDFAKLKALAPDFDWAAAFRTLGVSTSGLINVRQPELVKTINQEIATGPIETWKTWLRWRALDYWSPYLTESFYNAGFHFHRTVIAGVAEVPPRWKICVAQADSTLGDTLGRLFMQKYFSAETRRRMNEMVANLRSTLEDELKSSEWLAPETRKNALLKLAAFDARIGGQVKLRDYRNVHVERGGYLAAKESAWRADRLFDAGKIGKARDRGIWRMTPPTVDANYEPENNSISFPAGVLQPPLFDLAADDAENYGATGVGIGHEMGHGFDDQGSKYDAQGNLKNWWTDQDRANFEKRAACVADQYEAFDIGGGRHHNGKLVTGESMAELGGLMTAYRAYHKSLGGKEAPVIDGFTGDQRFFIAYARVWAGNTREEAARQWLATNPHPLDKFRVNLSLQNLPEFQKAFGCAEGDAMVRAAAARCRLW